MLPDAGGGPISALHLDGPHCPERDPQQPRSPQHVRLLLDETEISLILIKNSVSDVGTRTCTLRGEAPGRHMSPRTTDQRFRRIFDANFDAVQAYCLRRLPMEEAADAVSEVFLVVWRRIDEVPPDDTATLWLFGVARNVVRNMGRSSRRRLRAIARVGGLAATRPTDPEMQVVAASEHREIMAAFHRLRRADQEILQLRLWEELSVAETATVLHSTDTAASKRYQRALSRLTRAAGMSSVPEFGPHLAPRGGEQ